MQAWWKWIIVAVVIVAISQLVRPSHVNPPVTAAHTIDANLAVDPAVAAVFKRSCNDCHSNVTVWPWYSEIAPVSWLIAYDVRRGRTALNFSEWAVYPAEKQQDLLKEICTEVSDNEMPGISYTLLHPDAKLTDAEMQSICRWTTSQQLKLPE